MSNRELTSGYEFPEKPIGFVFVNFILASIVTVLWLLAAFVLVFGVGVAYGILEAGDFELPEPEILIAWSVGIFAVLLVIGIALRGLARKLAKPYWPQSIN